MKKWMMLACLILAGLLSACGGGAKEPEAKQVDLTEVCAAMEEAAELPENYMVDIEGELLEMYYPGLAELDAGQLIARMPMMSAVACEVALVECQSQEDADRAAEIFQARIDYQVGDDENIGGAFYPAAIESWMQASVLRQGNYVAMLAVDGYQSQVEDIFNQAFA